MKSTLYKPRYRDRNTRELVESPTWWIRFRSHQRILCRWPADDREDRARRMVEQIAALIECRRNGETPDKRLTAWIDGLPQSMVDRLVEADLISERQKAGADLLETYLKGYEQQMEAQGDTPEHVALTIGRIKAAFQGCGFTFWRDLAPAGTATRIAVWLGGKRKAGTSGTTVNYYARALRSFGAWMVGSGNATSNLLAGVKGVRNAEIDKQETRPLSADEMRRVIAAAGAGGEWRPAPKSALTFSAADRAILYAFAYTTGIRPGQIRQLTVSCFKLDDEPPTVTSRAASVKRRKSHVQALQPKMAEELRKHLAAKMPEALAFHMPDKFLCAKMFRADLAAARETWIREGAGDAERERRQRSDFLADVDQSKRRAMFYSLRHSHGTALGEAGVNQKDIQASLHHTRSATTDRYVHADIEAKARAVNSLPDVLPEVVAKIATGTGCFASALPTQCSSVESGGMKNRVPIVENAVVNEGDGARTRNHRIDSPVL
jgi:integrase